jgi:hypothetical protein
MWPSPGTASLWYDIANIVLVVSLGLGVAATVVSVWMGKVQDRYLRRELSDAATVAAEANKRAAEATLELAKYRAPRTLTPSQRESFIRAMAPFKGQSVSVGAIPVTGEGGAFGVEIVNALNEAGLRASINQGAAEVHVGPVNGVLARATTGNTKGEQFAVTFARVLTELGIAAYWSGGKMEDIVKKQEKDDPNVRQSEYQQWVIIVVGNKP